MAGLPSFSVLSLFLLCAPLFREERPQIYTQAAPKSEPGRAARISAGEVGDRITAAVGQTYDFRADSVPGHALSAGTKRLATWVPLRRSESGGEGFRR
jgi:hypothetical protein